MHSLFILNCIFAIEILRSILTKINQGEMSIRKLKHDYFSKRNFTIKITNN
jgi:hypothetical protein